jgi:ABC-type sugar transport system substrate-binding protein
MKRMKKVLAIVLALCLALSLVCLTGCGDSKDEESGSAGLGMATKAKDVSSEPVKIAYIPLSASGETVTMTLEGFDYALAGYPNVTYQVYDPQFDVTTQLEMMNECITQGVDCIILQAADTTALNNVIAEAESAGIPVITQNTGCSAVRTVHVTNSDYNSGYQAGEYLDTNNIIAKDANVIVLDVVAEIKPNCRMGTGFTDYAKEKTNWNILAEQGIENTSQENANTAMRDLLTKYDDIDAVYCVNDDCAMGALQAIEAAGRENDGIIIWGFEGHPSTLKAIKEGRIYGTSYADLFTSSYSIMMMALYFVETGFTGTNAGYEYAPVMEFSTVPCTTDNCDEVLQYTHWDLD